MTPQEKLAALAEKWRKNARELGRNGDPNGVWNDTLNRCANELTTLLSEHGGGGEADSIPVSDLRAQLSEYADPDCGECNGAGIWMGNVLVCNCVLDAIPERDTTPPTPSAPDRVNCVECGGEGFTYDEVKAMLYALTPPAAAPRGSIPIVQDSALPPKVAEFRDHTGKVLGAIVTDPAAPTQEKGNG